MDEEELQKRFTDCVYFLASPLTCKKGIECEYRHSEIARLNPRDCWYWLGGCCFNPDCAFRHPPLEGLKEAYYEPSNLNNPPALPMEKTNIPCYFYSKGFCNKGEKCSFLHGPADVIHALKPSKPPSMVNNPIPSDKKSSEESKTGSPPLKPHPNPSENAQMDHTITMRKPTQDSHQEETTQDSEQEESTEDSDSDSDSGSDSDSEQEERSEESPDLSNSLDLQEEFVQSESDVFNDQSSGFDVVVEGEPERLDYEQDVDFFDHEEDPIEYDPTPPYPIELGNGFVKERYDVYDRLDKGQSRTSIFYRLSFKKQNLHSQPVFNGRKGHHDLREHLKRRKVVVDGGFKYDFSQGHNRNFRRQPQRKVVPVNRASRRPHAMQQKRRFCKGKSGVFTGPKSLGEIKEEKKNGFQGKDGFQGPRPLSEILKNKRKLG